MQRRKILLAATTVAAVGGFSPQVQSETISLPNELFCYAPDDVFIEEIFAINVQVKTGDKLVRLSSSKLLQYQMQIVYFKEMIAIYERSFKDGRVTKLLEMLKAEDASASEIFNKKNAILYRTKTNYDLGFSLIDTFLNAEIEASKAKAKKVSLATQLAQFPQKLKDSEHKILSIKQLLEKQENLLKKDEERMIIVAPRDGTFTLEVGLNGFAKKGDRIGKMRL